jgi:predicted metal-dependent hydrolase
MTDPLRPGSRHTIPVRKPDFPFDASIPRHWLGGNPLATQFFNGLNLVFPDGERFFIQSVRDHLRDIDDPELARQVRGFFGQEGRHAHEHERYFEILEAQGYRIDAFLRRFRRFSETMTRWLPRGVRLAMTAGAEHYTAIFGALALEDRFLLEEAHPTLRNLIVWHATEEIEHKAVAFDVFQTTHGHYVLRVVGFGLASAALFGWVAVAVHMLLKQDELSRKTLRRARAELREAQGNEWPRRIWRGVRAYLRPGFHPNDTDELSLAHRRLREIGLEPSPS